MQLTIDLGITSLVASATNRTPVSNLSFKRGDSVSIAIQFVLNGTVTDLEEFYAAALAAAGLTAVTGKFGLKVPGKYDDGFIVSDNGAGWVKTGSGITAVYTFQPSFNTVALNGLLDYTGGPLDSAPLMGEIEWIAGSILQSSNTFTATVANDVIKDDESEPEEIPSPTANTFYAGPASGPEAPPTFRNLVAADLFSATGWTLLSANHTAAFGERLTTDSSAGAFTLLLPATPALGKPSIPVHDASESWGAHPVSLGGNGNKINGSTDPLSLNVPGDKVDCIWVGGATGYLVS